VLYCNKDTTFFRANQYVKERFFAVISLSRVGFNARLAVMAGVAERLQVSEVEPRAAFVDWGDVVNHLRKGGDASSGALLTKR
jgi:hypothetical protein